ncbi:STAS domain-containing protein [Streptomyces sp. NPDC020917]|uniref:STAS domain-containing protein n=1 Tax=Streptomyces sp. NPDC020917 TaxID=3365102 RepID=UPI003799BE1C
MRTNIIRHENMMVSYDVVNGWTVVEIDGEVDAQTASMLREAVIKLLDGEPGEPGTDGAPGAHRDLVLDMGFVTFLDSMGLGVIVAITKRIREQGGSLRIASVPGRILRIFDLSGMGESYEFHPSAEQATSTAPAADSLAHWPHPSG